MSIVISIITDTAVLMDCDRFKLFLFLLMKAINLFLGALLVTLVLSQGYYSTKLAKRLIQISAISYEST